MNRFLSKTLNMIRLPYIKGWTRWRVYCLLAFPVMCVWGLVAGHAPLPGSNSLLFAARQVESVAPLDSAEDYYISGDFVKSIETANQFLKMPGVTEDGRIRAHKILTRCHIAQGDTLRARQNIIVILTMDDDYQPTIEQETPQFVNLVSRVKADHFPPAQKAGRSGLSKWIWVGAGGAATAAIIVLVANSGMGDNGIKAEPLPEPPPFPR